MKKKRFYFLSIFSGLLLAFSWPPSSFSFLIFFAFVPLLQLEQIFSLNQTSAKGVLLFGLSYLTFFIWNLYSVYWICNASLGGGAMAIIGNSLLMAMAFWIFHRSKKLLLTRGLQPRMANWLFVLFWLSFEYLHFRWDLSWPWLTLGNVFAGNHTWIQWYEYTGTSGGSLWVLVSNLLFLEWINGKSKFVFVIVAILLIPILISLRMYTCYIEKQNPLNVVVVQPNIDPYNEKFDGMDYNAQLTKMLTLAKQKTDSTTDYLVFPETALTEDIWDNDIKQTESYNRLKDFSKPFPRLNIIVGASTFHLYNKGEKISTTARKINNQEKYYDSYNAALQINNTDSAQVYNKSKLVLGVERMPYPMVFGFLENLIINLGGTSGSLGTQEEPSVFKSKIKIAPVICYESVYGEYVSEFIRKGASLICIITNDGWWGDTEGHTQHLLYGKLRAIETRRSIARSANTGTSCFINQRGDVISPTEWWQPTVIKTTLNANFEKTVYVQLGDSIGKFCFYVSVIILLYVTAVSLFFVKNKINIGTHRNN